MDNTTHGRRWRWLRIFRIILIAPFLLLILCWLVLYGDSLYQRRKAEKLLKDLRAFPFATANFVEVREFVLAHGGRADESQLVYRPPKAYWALPLPPATGIGHWVFGYEDGSPCSPQDCSFHIEVSNKLSWLWLPHDWTRSFYVDLDSLGLRPWKFRVDFQIADGKLKGTGVGVVSLQSAKEEQWRDIYATAYGAQVTTDRYWLHGKSVYNVRVQLVTGPPQQNLEAAVLSTAPAQIGRALDIDLACATRLSAGCRGFDELAPSAWADYQSQNGWQPPRWSETEFGSSFSLVWLFLGGTIFVGTLAVIGALLERFRPEKPGHQRILQ